MVEKIKIYKVIHCTVFFLNSIGFKFATMSVCAETYLHFLSLNRSGYGANQKWLCYHCKNETWSCAKELVLILSIPTWRSLTQHLLPSIQTPSLITYTFIECTQSDCIIFVYSTKVHRYYALSWNIPMDLLIGAVQSCLSWRIQQVSDSMSFVERTHTLQVELLCVSKGRVTFQYI